MNFEDYKHNSEEERLFIETHSALSRLASKIIRSLPSDQRLPALRKNNPTDESLLSLYLFAMQQEDYETCEVAKALIEERGIPVTKWPHT